MYFSSSSSFMAGEKNSLDDSLTQSDITDSQVVTYPLVIVPY